MTTRLTVNDDDFRDWREQVSRELSKVPGRPTLDDFTDEAILYSYSERCDTPRQASIWLRA